MSNYSQITDFSVKDSLPSGNSNKLILGADYDAEFSAISTAISSKYDSTNLADTAAAEAATSSTVLMTPERVGDWSANRNINTNQGVKGGGDLSADRSISLDIIGLITSSPESSDYLAYYDSSDVLNRRSSIDQVVRTMAATQSQVDTGTNGTVYVTPLTLAAYSGLGGDSPTVQSAIKSSGTTRASTTTQTNDPDLSGLTLEPSSVYKIEALLEFDGQGATANGFRCGFEFSNGFADIQASSNFIRSTEVTGGPVTSIDADDSFSGFVRSTFRQSAIPATVEMVFILETQSDFVSGTTVAVEWAQGTSNATGTRLDSGSSLIVTKLS